MTASPTARPPYLTRRLASAGPARTTHLRHDGAELYVLPRRYCVTSLILSGDAVAVVDVGSSADVEPILDCLRGLGRDPSEVRLVSATHLHFDHILGLDDLALRVSAPVALSSTALDQLSGRTRYEWPRQSPAHLVGLLSGWIMQGMPRPPLADFGRARRFGFPWSPNRFAARVELLPEHPAEFPDFPGWTVLRTPGHSAESVSFHHREAGWLICGDAVLNFRGGEWNNLLSSESEYRKTKELLRELAPSVIVPSHGPPLTGPRLVEGLRVTSPAWP